MTQDDTPAETVFHPSTHPSWCDRSCCTIAEARPYGAHQSASIVIPADPPIGVVAELHLISTMPGYSPDVLLMLELDIDTGLSGAPATFPLALPLTLRQARQLRIALDKLLGAAGPDRRSDATDATA